MHGNSKWFDLVGFPDTQSKYFHINQTKPLEYLKYEKKKKKLVFSISRQIIGLEANSDKTSRGLESEHMKIC